MDASKRYEHRITVVFSFRSDSDTCTDSLEELLDIMPASTPDRDVMIWDDACEVFTGPFEPYDI